MQDQVTFFPNWRGGDPYLDRLASALTDQGWRCRIVGRAGLLWALARAIVGRGTVHVHWFEGFNPGRNWRDGVIAWCYLPLLWFAGRRGRLVWTVHNLTPHNGNAPLNGPTFQRMLACVSSRILVHFEETGEILQQQFAVGDKIAVTPIARFGHAHGPPIDRLRAREQIFAGLGTSRLLFVQVGSVRRYKHPATTILAFREAAPESAMLLVAGPCDDLAVRSEVQEAAANDSRIILRLEWLTDEELVSALCAADWSICPYRSIQNPGAVNLSVAYGCPVIAPALNSVQALTAGQPAVLYSPEGPSQGALVDAIRSAITHGPRATPGTANFVSVDEQARQTIHQYNIARLGLPLRARNNT